MRIWATVKIADEVVAIIAGLAATGSQKVFLLWQGMRQDELIAKLGMKSLSKGVKVDVPGTACKGGL